MGDMEDHPLACKPTWFQWTTHFFSDWRTKRGKKGKKKHFYWKKGSTEHISGPRSDHLFMLPTRPSTHNMHMCIFSQSKSNAKEYIIQSAIFQLYNSTPFLLIEGKGKNFFETFAPSKSMENDRVDGRLWLCPTKKTELKFEHAKKNSYKSTNRTTNRTKFKEKNLFTRIKNIHFNKTSVQMLRRETNDAISISTASFFSCSPFNQKKPCFFKLKYGITTLHRLFDTSTWCIHAHLLIIQWNMTVYFWLWGKIYDNRDVHAETTNNDKQTKIQQKNRKNVPE